MLDNVKNNFWYFAYALELFQLGKSETGLLTTEAFADESAAFG